MIWGCKTWRYSVLLSQGGTPSFLSLHLPGVLLKLVRNTLGRVLFTPAPLTLMGGGPFLLSLDSASKQIHPGEVFFGRQMKIAHSGQIGLVRGDPATPTAAAARLGVHSSMHWGDNLPFHCNSGQGNSANIRPKNRLFLSPSPSLPWLLFPVADPTTMGCSWAVPPLSPLLPRNSRSPTRRKGGRGAGSLR